MNSENKTKNKSLMRDPVLCRVEAHNSLLRNFLMNKSSNIINSTNKNNNIFMKDNKENIYNNIISNNKFNNNNNTNTKG